MGGEYRLCRPAWAAGHSGKFSYLTYISNFIIVSLSVIIVVSTSIFLLMQVTFVKKYSLTYINKSKTYPYIRKTYTNLFSTKFVKTNIIARSPSFLWAIWVSEEKSILLLLIYTSSLYWIFFFI